MTYEPSFATVASLIGDPARALILTALLDGRSYPAGELANAAGIGAPTASSHLGKLADAGLLLVERQGRHRYYRLAGPHVAQALEALASLTPKPKKPRSPPPAVRELRLARCCYDHLAGRLGVALTRVLESRGFLLPEGDKQYAVTHSGARWFADLGIEIEKLRSGKNVIAGRCLDWTEREHHLSGPLGVRFMHALCDAGWLRRSKKSRRVDVTPIGWAEIKSRFDVDLSGLISE